MSSDSQISAAQTFGLLRQASVHLLDVRSQKEFAKGQFAASSNIPILSDDHRHIVGLTYKAEGQDAAIALGYRLVEPLKQNMVGQWAKVLQSSPGLPLVMCWRGGMRSELACQWLRDVEVKAIQVIGGYKALRQIVLKQLEQPANFVVLAGFTGSRKTNLLMSRRRSLDLEALAQHRGSSFGRIYGREQPAQATFENNLAIELSRLQTHTAPILVEDESVNLGRCFFPPALNGGLANGRVVWLEIPLSERIANIYTDYVKEPLSSGISRSQLLQHYFDAVQRIRTALGGQLTDVVASAMTTAFTQEAHNEDPDLHGLWITPLLENYYDKRYRHACERLARPELFRGDVKGVTEFLSAMGF